MDFLESIGKQLSEITVYDVKSALDKAKNMVMNYTEMESKVREATNDDAWGANTTLMTEIASGTFNFQLFNEIMPVIYKRFTEKEARDWRQIYKALQLLEHLVKNGSERVVDDARSHLSMIKMLRNFHYVDEKGKDQGINVRNRSKELAELLGDLDRVRQERRKAKNNRSKFTGVSNEESAFGSSSRKYGGFGSDAYDGRASPYGRDSSSSYPSSSQRDETRHDNFEEYDAGDDDDRSGVAAGTTPSTSMGRGPSSSAPAPVQKDIPTSRQPQKEINLFDFDDEPIATSPVTKASIHNRAVSFDDDFDDFQSASAIPGSNAAQPPSQSQPVQQTRAGAPNFFDMMGSSSSTAIAPITTPMQFQGQGQMRTTQNIHAGPNYTSTNTYGASASPSRPAMATHTSSFGGGMVSAMSSTSGAMPSPQKPKNNTSAFDFDDLFALSGAKSATGGSKTSGTGTSMANLAAQQQNSQIWGGSTGAGGAVGNNHYNDDLLF